MERVVSQRVPVRPQGHTPMNGVIAGSVCTDDIPRRAPVSIDE